MLERESPHGTQRWLAPILALGTLLGVWFGDVASQWLPGVVPDADVFAVVGMGALFAAVVRAPLTGIADVELSAHLAPARDIPRTSVVSYRLGGQPIYSRLLQRTLAAEQNAGGKGSADAVDQSTG